MADQRSLKPKKIEAAQEAEAAPEVTPKVEANDLHDILARLRGVDPDLAAKLSVWLDQPLGPSASASEVGLSEPSFWRQVADGRLPHPLYPSPRKPIWFRSELRAAVLATRQRPADAMAARRIAHINSERETTGRKSARRIAHVKHQRDAAGRKS